MTNISLTTTTIEMISIETHTVHSDLCLTFTLVVVLFHRSFSLCSLFCSCSLTFPHTFVHHSFVRYLQFAIAIGFCLFESIPLQH